MLVSRKLLGSFAVCLACAAAPVSAATVDLVSVMGTWTNANPSAAISGVGTSLIQWGNPSGQPNQSGYRFDDAAAQNNLLSGVDFDLGTFTHLNNPINGTTLDDAELTVVIGLSIDNGATQFVNTIFDFDHVETPNLPSSSNPDPSQTCANNQANAQGVNINGCADLVTATTNSAFSQSFMVGGTSYIFEFSGFQHNGMLLNDFWTQERADNSAVLRASYQIETAAVPLPAAAWLFMAALGSLGVLKRRASKSV